MQFISLGSAHPGRNNDMYLNAHAWALTLKGYYANYIQEH